MHSFPLGVYVYISKLFIIMVLVAVVESMVRQNPRNAFLKMVMGWFAGYYGLYYFILVTVGTCQLLYLVWPPLGFVAASAIGLFVIWLSVVVIKDLTKKEYAMVWADWDVRTILIYITLATAMGLSRGDLLMPYE
jgi:hypothetical protein